ncbi:MAG TPA: hypothetical protein VFS00_20680 [Polyangiaceae bacterium]|nr:hypothetical protein [Polyangiaceae bacterium]
MLFTAFPLPAGAGRYHLGLLERMARGAAALEAFCKNLGPPRPTGS